MTGTLVNTAAILAGSTIGMLVRSRASNAAAVTVIQGLGLATLFIGFEMAYRWMVSESPRASVLLVLLSMALGGYLGERWRIEARLESLGERARKAFERRFGREDGEFARAFVASSLLFAVGPMAVVGSLSDGMFGDSRLLLTKSVMDGIASAALAATMGPGVYLSAGSVFAYQGALTLAGAYLGRSFGPATLAALSASGGLLIVAIGLNMVGATRIATGNLLPALAVAPILAWIWPYLGLP
ncbi:MAG: DUF554 domain-containing protein [Bacillota bacterium]